jgi:hypothetical protein
VSWRAQVSLTLPLSDSALSPRLVARSLAVTKVR